MEEPSLFRTFSADISVPPVLIRQLFRPLIWLFSGFPLVSANQNCVRGRILDKYLVMLDIKQSRPARFNHLFNLQPGKNIQIIERFIPYV